MMANDMDWFWQAVVSGVTIAAIVGGFQGIRASWRQREQIKRLRLLLRDTYAKMAWEKPLPPTPGGTEVSLRTTRAVLFEGLLRDVEATISYRSPDLHYTRLHQLREVLQSVKAFMAMLKEHNKSIDGEMPLYDEFFFDPLNALEWLRFGKDSISPKAPGSPRA